MKANLACTLLLLTALFTLPSCNLATCREEQIDTGDDCVSEDDRPSSSHAGTSSGGANSGGTSSGGGGASSPYEPDEVHAVISPLRAGFTSDPTMALVMQLLQAGVEGQQSLSITPRLAPPTLNYTGECPGSTPRAGLDCEQGEWRVSYTFQNSSTTELAYELSANTSAGERVNVSGATHADGREEFQVSVTISSGMSFHITLDVDCDNDVAGKVQVPTLRYNGTEHGGFSVGCHIS